jgi:hypothetical protein
MEYLPGGDLMRLLMREDTLPEAAARHYMVEHHPLTIAQTHTSSLTRANPRRRSW